MAKGSTDITSPASELRREDRSGQVVQPARSCGNFGIRIVREGDCWRATLVGRRKEEPLNGARLVRARSGGAFASLCGVERPA